LALIVALILQLSIKLISKINLKYKESLRSTLISFFIAYTFVQIWIYILITSANADKIYTAPISGIVIAIILLFILFSNTIRKYKAKLMSDIFEFH
jgi:apolipoprotein N-acyltransferase